jgi:hypothetical protein
LRVHKHTQTIIEQKTSTMEQEGNEPEPDLVLLQDVDKQMMMDNIINAGTRRGYIADSLGFVNWSRINQPHWVSDSTLEALLDLEAKAEGMQSRQQKSMSSLDLHNYCRNQRCQPSRLY